LCVCDNGQTLLIPRAVTIHPSATMQNLFKLLYLNELVRKKMWGLSLCLYVFIIFSVTGGLSLIHSGTFVQAQISQLTVNGQITPPLDVADSIYNANTSTFLGSKNLSFTPYRMTEERFSEQGFLKGSGYVTNNQTFINTYLSDELLQGRGNGTFETPDGQSITWISSDIGRSVDGRWDFYGIMLFNNTQSESLSILNNSIGLSKSTAPLTEPEFIWLLE
jgi:hypothetical protein